MACRDLEPSVLARRFALELTLVSRDMEAWSEELAQLDSYYLSHQSLLLDCEIIISVIRLRAVEGASGSLSRPPPRPTW